MTTATLQHCPASEVPQPRVSSGAPWRLQAETVARTSLTSFGITTPMGGWR